MKTIIMLLPLLFISGCQKHTPDKHMTLNLGDTSKCLNYSGMPPNWSNDKTAGMVQLPAGQIQLGTTEGYADEKPFKQELTSVKSFWIDATEVTNAQFAEFVQQTGYITDAEKQGGAAVFIQPTAPVAEMQWWVFKPDANWKQPWGGK